MSGRALTSPIVPLPANEKIRIGISSCLLGERVRYDGAHKRDTFVCDVLADEFDLVPVCPEVAIGMGVPRPSIRLVGDARQPRALGVADETLDVTAPLTAFGRRMAVELDDIDAYIFKSRSPSCGPARVKVYNAGKVVRAQGTGLYAREIMARQPLLPVAEEARLTDGQLRDNFLERVFAYHRWRQLLASGFSVAKLVEFHSRHKLNVMAHGTVQYRALGRLVAQAKTLRSSRLAEEYGSAFIAALQHNATRKRHANVLHHLMGYLKKSITHEDKAELLATIDAYRLGATPLIAPLTLLRHHFRRFPDPYVSRQIYLYPSGLEARLRQL